MDKGLQGWVEILKGGRLADRTGQVRDTDTLIDKAVSSFNGAIHEPPIVLGGSSDAAPAWGWVKALKSEFVNGAKRLFMLPDQVHPEFGEGVMTGRYKKSGVVFYPDGRLKLIRFAGDTPPVLPLMATSFARDDGMFNFEFSEGDLMAGPERGHDDGLSWRDIQGITNKV